MKLTPLSSLSFREKKVLVRVDFNVPLAETGEIADDTRIRASLPTIEAICKAGGSPILLSHLGRPEGKVNSAYSLRPVAKRLGELLGKPVAFSPDCVGESAEKAASALRTGEVLLLENLRFHLAEEKPKTDPTFAEKLAKLGDLYVDDAFGTAHRKHSSTYYLPELFPEKRAAGLLIEKEVRALSSLLEHPKRPFYAIIGGSKISTKIGILSSLSGLVDSLFIGGAMAYTFFKAKGIAIGDSLYEEEQLETAKKFLELCEKRNIPLHFPLDLLIAQKVDANSPPKIIIADEGIPPGWQGVDIGPKTRLFWKTLFAEGKTFFWNGPVGVFEIPAFAEGTEAIALALAEQKGAQTVVGGGDSLAAVNGLGLGSHFSHLSTGGGASLEFLEYGHLPGIDVLCTN